MQGGTLTEWNELEVIAGVQRYLVEQGELSIIGDDAAEVSTQSGRVVLCADAIADGIHFQLSVWPPELIGRKVVAVNLSDLAAMGARPRWLLATLAAPADAPAREIALGIAKACASFGVSLVGGDTIRAATTVISATAIGEPLGSATIPRGGARPGDAIFLTGPLGGSALGLSKLDAGEPVDLKDPAINRHLMPSPRLAESRALVACGATSAIDVSDGLSIDLHRLADMSATGFALTLVPVFPGATEMAALSGGEDFELAFTHPDAGAVQVAFAEAGCAPPIQIGTIVPDSAGRTLRGVPLDRTGYIH